MRNPECQLCPLHLGTKNVCMDGRGANKPKFLFVGDYANREDDKQGEAFTGQAGNLLMEHIKKFGLYPARLTNAVRCFPPIDRDPNQEEIMACRQYLSQEIQEHRPQYLVAVGGLALKLLTGKTGITTWSGRIAGEIKGMTVLGLLHPAYIMRSGDFETFRKDCVGLKEIVATVDLFKKHFPKASIRDAEGFTMSDKALEMSPADREAEMMLKFKARLRPYLMAQVPSLLSKARREEKKNGREAA